MLTDNSDYPQCPGLIDRLAYWTAPGSVADAIAYVHAHPPDRLPLSVHGTNTNTKAHVTVTFLDFGTISLSGDGSQVHIAVTTFGPGVALRADAQAIWNGGDGCVVHGAH